jgi:hypothetical protein
MSLWFRHRLLEWVLRLRIPPFVWFYAFVHHLACTLVVRLLHRRPGLVAIYLSGSSVAGRTHFGLSDIDFKIILAGRRDAREMKIIRRRFLWLRRWFPMLGPPDEKGLYFLDDLADEYRTYPLVRLLFDSRFYRHRLLWGQDWIGRQQFSLLGKNDLEQALPWRLKEWNEKILLLLDAASFARPQRRYLLWKALADVGRFLSLLRKPSLVEILPRGEAVAFLAEQLPAALRQSVSALQEEQTCHILVDRMSDEQRFDLWREVLRFVSLRLDEGTEISATTVVAHAAERNEALDPHGQVLRQMAPSGARCSLLDFFFVPSSPLDTDGYGSFMRIIRMPRALRASEYQALKREFREGKLGREPIFVVERGEMGHCLWSQMLDHYFVTATSADGLLPFVNAAEQGLAGYSAGTHFVKRLKLRLDRSIVQLPSVLDSPQAPRLGRKRLLRFFFSNLQTLYLAAEVSGEAGLPRVLHLPGGPEALVDLLIERGLGKQVASFLRQKAQVLRCSAGPVAWSSLKHLLVRGLEVAARRRTWQDVDLLPDEALTISLVLVTRNRARLLERCLNSVRAQLRPPDELVVVDNGSTDETAEVVRRFQPAYPVRYIVETRPGVGCARAAGCVAATGDILAFIDDDAIPEPGWLTAMEETFCLDPRVGVVGGRINALAGGRIDWISRAFGRFGER